MVDFKKALQDKREANKIKRDCFETELLNVVGFYSNRITKKDLVKTLEYVLESAKKS